MGRVKGHMLSKDTICLTLSATSTFSPLVPASCGRRRPLISVIAHPLLSFDPPAALPPFLFLQRAHWSPEDTDTHFKGSSAWVFPYSSSSSRGHTVKLGRMPGLIELRGSLTCIVGRARYLAYLYSADKIRRVCVCVCLCGSGKFKVNKNPNTVAAVMR